jgi:hypothetical protein
MNFRSNVDDDHEEFIRVADDHEVINIEEDCGSFITSHTSEDTWVIEIGQVSHLDE